MDWLSDPNAWVTLVTLTSLEIVLGIDNVIFISVLASRLQEPYATRARQIGLGFAMISRIALLVLLFWAAKLTEPVITILGAELSWRDLVLLGGGLFLVGKATTEIHHTVEGEAHEGGELRGGDALLPIIAQIAVIDLVFSLDSVITAVALADHLQIMVMAIVIAVGVMYFASGPTSAFVQRHPTTKMLALAFLLMIGGALIADALDFHIPRGYLYAAMGFAVLVELLNLVAAGNRKKNTQQQH